MSIINVHDVITPLVRGQQQATNRVMQKALQRSAGKYKANKLAKLGYPYSSRNVGGWVPYSDPGIINVQSGTFYLSWKKKDAKLVGDAIVSSVYNDDPKGDILAKGKKSTMPRPLIQGLLPTAEYWQKWWLIRSIKDAVNLCNSQ